MSIIGPKVIVTPEAWPLHALHEEQYPEPSPSPVMPAAQVSGGLQGYGVPNQGNQMWNSGGQYSAAELSGWGTNLNAAGLPNANLDAAALLATQVSTLLDGGPSWGSDTSIRGFNV